MQCTGKIYYITKLIFNFNLDLSDNLPIKLLETIRLVVLINGKMSNLLLSALNQVKQIQKEASSLSTKIGGCISILMFISLTFYFQILIFLACFLYRR